MCGSDSDVVKLRGVIRGSYLHFCEFLASWNSTISLLALEKSLEELGLFDVFIPRLCLVHYISPQCSTSKYRNGKNLDLDYIIILKS